MHVCGQGTQIMSVWEVKVRRTGPALTVKNQTRLVKMGFIASPARPLTQVFVRILVSQKQ